jgi:hypothetical protein
VRLLHESGWALVEGDFQASQQFAIEAYEVGTASGQPDAMRIFGAQLFQIRYSQGLAGELVEQSVRLAGGDSLSAWRAAAAVALIESGQEDQARELTLAEDFQSVPSDDIWSIGMFLWADACSRLRVADRAGELYELLAPFSGQLARTGTVVCSIPWALGSLATTLERYEQAEGHFADAAQIEARLGAPLFLARTHTGWARALIARGLPEDIEHAKQMLEQANDTAARLGARLITREVEGCRADLAAISG